MVCLLFKELLVNKKQLSENVNLQIIQDESWYKQLEDYLMFQGRNIESSREYKGKSYC